MSGDATSAAPLRAFVAQLAASGVRHAVVCPGSRSTPLALALRANPAIRVLVHLDERAGAYLALGLVRASRSPVAILGTSGTAVVNFAPAVAEAAQGRVPLVVLTADRPPELRDRGANQTIDQHRLYGSHAKWFAELPVPDGSLPDEEAHVAWTAARAVAIATTAPAGPVHVNWPFREPLVPSGSLAPERGRVPVDPVTILPAAPPALPPETADELRGRLAAAARPLIVCGPLDVPEAAGAIAALGAAGSIPIVADALANLRAGAHDRSAVITRHDAILRATAFRTAHAPDLVLRFGATPTSKALATWLRETDAEQLVVDDGGWNEPYLRVQAFVRADPALVAVALASAPLPAGGRASWLEAWRGADEAADRAIRDALAELAGRGEPFEGSVFADLADHVPHGTILYVGNSMPVRDLDAFLPSTDRRVRILGNRGASGIDGVVSSALGAAAAGAGPVVAVVGDLSFVHDMNALVAARLHRLDITVVVVDNDGGGIFSFLPQASADRPDAGLPEHYEELFGTPHGTDVLAVAAALGAQTADLEPGRIGEAIAASLARPGIRVLRLRTDRRRNVELHREITAAAVAAVEAALAAGLPR
ncbi:MAG TPA: 2-succinyl-5-enolpyruvyl-6-hydroxy-3-cyclohexene-1-carboxylic-acid synthase [Candidatus Limnocylindrales bacterium]|nr:2-succinyl-5-enolpyruvyl-6-hydroxy-3-cyclohexene-1-carboxylic-acid synthase [Candidatus Limnocylindrales bacterium]